MRILIYGTGAVGGYFGARLAQARNEVTFLTRGTNLQAIREGGLYVESPKGNYRVWPIRATDNIADLASARLIILGVKAWQVPEVARTLPEVMGSRTQVLTLQNGIDAPFEVAKEIGVERVLGCVCRIIAAVVAPGHIRHLGMEPSITIGHLGKTDLSGDISIVVETLRSAGISADTTEDMESALWKKLVFIGAMSGVGAATRSTIGEIRTLHETREMLQGAMEEIGNVAKAKGVSMDRDIVSKTMAFVDSLPPSGTASMQRDLADGRPSELEAIVGAVIRTAQASGVDTPINRLVYSALLPQERRARMAHSLSD